MAGERDRRGDRGRGAVYIAPARVYTMVTEGRESLIRIEGKVDAIDRSVSERLDDLESDIEKVAERVTPLEHRVWAWPSLAGLVGLAALVLTVIQMTTGAA